MFSERHAVDFTRRSVHAVECSTDLKAFLLIIFGENEQITVAASGLQEDGDAKLAPKDRSCVTVNGSDQADSKDLDNLECIGTKHGPMRKDGEVEYRIPNIKLAYHSFYGFASYTG